MNELIISMILMIIFLFFIGYISRLNEDVKKMNRTLDKLVNHLGIEIYSNIDDELRDIIKNDGKIKAIKIYSIEENEIKFNNKYFHEECMVYFARK